MINAQKRLRPVYTFIISNAVVTSEIKLKLNWNKTNAKQCFVSVKIVLFQFYFRCNHCLRQHSQNVCRRADDVVLFNLERMRTPASPKNADRGCIKLKLCSPVSALSFSKTSEFDRRACRLCPAQACCPRCFKAGYGHVNIYTVSRFSKLLHCWKASKIATKTLTHYPPHLTHVATLPWEMKNAFFCRYSARMEENAKSV